MFLRNLFFCFVFVFCIQSFPVNFIVEQDDYTRKSYNKLTDPISSDEKLKSIGSFEALFEEARTFSSKFSFVEDLGLRLAHKHFVLSEGECILERTIVDPLNHLSSHLDASPVSVKKGFLPASWIWNSSQNRFDPFEYSADQLVADFHSRNLSSKEFESFMNGMQVLLEKHGVLDILCPAIMSREISSFLVPSQHIFLEETFLNPLISRTDIVLKSDVDVSSSIETGWYLGKPGDWGCRCASFCSSGSGGHSRNHQHFWTS